MLIKRLRYLVFIGLFVLGNLTFGAAGPLGFDLPEKIRIIQGQKSEVGARDDWAELVALARPNTIFFVDIDETIARGEDNKCAVDEMTSQYLDQIYDKGALILFLTARKYEQEGSSDEDKELPQDRTEQLVSKVLKGANYRWINKTFKNGRIGDQNKYAGYQNGIISANVRAYSRKIGQTSKGKGATIEDFLRRYKLQPELVVVIDNSAPYIRDIVNYLQKMNIGGVILKYELGDWLDKREGYMRPAIKSGLSDREIFESLRLSEDEFQMMKKQIESTSGGGC